MFEHSDDIGQVSKSATEVEVKPAAQQALSKKHKEDDDKEQTEICGNPNGVFLLQSPWSFI